MKLIKKAKVCKFVCKVCGAEYLFRGKDYRLLRPSLLVSNAYCPNCTFAFTKDDLKEL